MNILIIKTSSLGDIVHAFPSLSYLKQKFPHAKIDWIVEKPFAPLVLSHPFLNKILCIDTKKWRKAPFTPQTWSEIAAFRRDLQSTQYDAVFDLQGNAKSGVLTFLSRAPAKIGFGKKSVPESINLLVTNKKFEPALNGNIRNDYLSVVQVYYNDHAPYQDESFLLKIDEASQSKLATILTKLNFQQHPLKIMVCPGSAWPNKQLLPETLLALLQKISSTYPCSFAFAWGSPYEHEWCDTLHAQFLENSIVLEKMPLPLLQNLMAKMDVVIAMDSLPLHLAGLAGVPTFSVFGPSSAKKYAPMAAHNVTFQGECPYGRTFEKRCPVLRTCPSGACIHDLKAERLFEKFVSMFAPSRNSI